MKRTEIAALFRQTPPDGTPVTVCGWAKTVRDSKNIGFLSLSDGSCFKPVQVVFEAAKLANYKEIAKAGVGTSLKVEGTLVHTPGAKQPFEVNASAIAILGACGPEYPYQPGPSAALPVYVPHPGLVLIPGPSLNRREEHFPTPPYTVP